METMSAPVYASFSVEEVAHVGIINLTSVRRNPANGELATQKFYENAGHGGEMRPFKPVGWDHKLAEELSLRGSSAGNDNDVYNSYWVSWTDSAGLHSLAITQEEPLTVPLLPGDRIIHPPILTLDKKQRIYFWRREGEKHSLFRHVFSGEIKQKGSVVTEKILELPYEPLLTVADPIAMALVRKKGFEERGLAVIGWLSSQGDTMQAHAVWLDGDKPRVFDSDPIAGYTPFPKQRPGLWASPEGKVHLAWVMGRADSDSCRAGKWKLDVKTGAKNLRIQSEAFGGKLLHAAACVLLRTDRDESATCYMLTGTGNLYMQYSSGKPAKLRSDVPLAYDFPIFASAVQQYEAQSDGKGGVLFTSPHPN